MTEELLAADEAQQIGLEFIRGLYYRGKVNLRYVELVTEGAFPMYHLEGSITVPSRNVMGRMFYQDSPYTFQMQVHATEGSILGYELK